MLADVAFGVAIVVERNAMKNDCIFCDATDRLMKAMELLDGIEIMNEPFFDDPTAAAYQALDDACPTWRCPVDGKHEEQQ